MDFFAYIDPFTGSLVLQVLAMAFFSVVIFFQRVKAAILSVFGFKKKTSETLDEEPETIVISPDTEMPDENHKAA